MSGKLPWNVTICLLICFGSQAHAREIFELRRAKHQDPVNVLYLFARHQGIETNTDGFRKAMKDVLASRDLFTMLSASKGINCKSRLTKLTIADLASISFPACILLVGEGTSEGKWHLLSYVASDHVAIVHGETMVVEQIPISDFRSKWNGNAIVPVDVPSMIAMALRILSLVVSSVIFIQLFHEGFAKCIRKFFRCVCVSRLLRTLAKTL